MLGAFPPASHEGDFSHHSTCTLATDLTGLYARRRVGAGDLPEPGLGSFG